MKGVWKDLQDKIVEKRAQKKLMKYKTWCTYVERKTAHVISIAKSLEQNGILAINV